MWLRRVSQGLIRGKDAFDDIAPAPWFLIKSPVIYPVVLGANIAIRAIRKEPAEEIVGKVIGRMALKGLGRRSLMHGLEKGCHVARFASAKPWRKINGLGGRSDFIMRPEIDADSNGRIIKRMVIVYHHANRAGKHVDVHIGRRSLVYRITGKPVEKRLKFNSNGMLTEKSKEELLRHLRQEIGNNSRVAQNLDHSLSNARMSWPFMPELAAEHGYGMGPTRQVIAEQDVEFYHHPVHSSLHLYAPIINPDQGLYLYQLYPGDEKRAPIAIFGTLEPLPEKKYHERLHLKLIQPEDFKEKFVGKIDKLSSTRKYDGASCYFSSNGQGFKFFSPRTHKENGVQIEYTFKLAQLTNQGLPEKPVGMGEVMFFKRTRLGKIANWFGFKGPEKACWNYESAANVGGMLNSNSIIPRNVHPELRIYRVDRWNGKDVNSLPFFDNRRIQLAMLSKLKDPGWNIVRLERPVQNPRTMRFEGFVGVPEGLSVNEGLKIKWWADANDWEVIRNEFSLSDKGNIQGVIWFKSLESGKEFKLGPGQIGSFDDCMVLMEAGNKTVGMVAKVHGRQGHEGRAAKLVEWHLDKGRVPKWFKG